MDFFSYIFMPSAQKTAWLSGLARRDAFYAQILQDLEAFGFDIRYPHLGGAGAYKFGALMAEGLDFQSGFEKELAAGRMRAEFSLKPRFGPDIAAHTWLHELTHFFQDMHGLYFTPLLFQGRMPVMLGARSDMAAVLFCEAMAAAEAIRASWRLKIAGSPEPWRGALFSWDWGGLARRYKDLMTSGRNERSAAAEIFKAFYRTPQRGYYEAHALALHERNLILRLSNAGINNPRAAAEYFRSVELASLPLMIPAAQRPDYLVQIDWADPIFAVPAAGRAKRRLAAIEAKFGKAENARFQDIEIGAPPSLWKEMQVKRAA